MECVECLECLECVTSLVTKVTQRVFCFQAYRYCIVVYCCRNKGSFVLSICVNIVLFRTQRSFVFKHLCQYCIALNTDKGVMTSNDIREECLECHMTRVTYESCVNKPIVLLSSDKYTKAGNTNFKEGGGANHNLLQIYIFSSETLKTLKYNIRHSFKFYR